MLYLANNQTNTITEVSEINPELKSDKNFRYFNKALFEKNEKGRAENWAKSENSKSRYSKQFELISDSIYKFFFDLEFHYVSKEILSVGFVVTKNNKVIERFFSYVFANIQLTEEDIKRLHISQEDISSAPNIQEVFAKMDKIIEKYSFAQSFIWSNNDARVLNEQTWPIQAKAFDCIFYATDLQAKLKEKFSIPVISLENALKNTDYAYWHTFNALDDAEALSWVYWFAEICDRSFVEGLQAYSVFANSKKRLTNFRILEGNMSLYKEEIAQLSSGNISPKEHKRLLKVQGKYQKLLTQKVNLNLPELETIVNNSIFA